MKQTKREYVSYYLDWVHGDKSISEIRKDLDELEKLGVTNIEITKERDWDGGFDIEINPFRERLETDQEYSERLTKEELERERNKQYELRQLEILKSKYENNNEAN